ncbi:LppU/SCO3897 family protein [Kitasatospora cineracea]|uniref:LppU/SCO3897 family protein n=1 Tax=Kitasatospora cineracea TaxID=88074 RepID=UPI0037991AB1
MSAPPPYPNQPYGQPPAPQPYGAQPYSGQPYGGQPYGGQPYGSQPYGGQPAYGQPPVSGAQPHAPYAQQPAPGPRPPAPRRRSPLQAALSVGIVLAIFGGGAWYVWNYNTSPTGGKAKAEASRSARAVEAKTHDPEIGDCVKVADPEGHPVPTIVDCASPEAEYKMADQLLGDDKHCGKEFDYGIRYVSSRRIDSTLCFTKIRH